MNIIQILFDELQQEAVTTRKMLERVPADKFDWQPHKKSMTLRNLSTHIADIPSWVALAINDNGLDFQATPYVPKPVTTTQEVLDIHEKSLSQGVQALETAKEEILGMPWRLTSGSTLLVDTTKFGMIRTASSQTIHHRAQLGVYLRLLDIPIPGSYGPSADDHKFS